MIDRSSHRCTSLVCRVISRARGRASWAGAGDVLHHIPGKQKDRHRDYANGSEFTDLGSCRAMVQPEHPSQSPTLAVDPRSPEFGSIEASLRTSGPATPRPFWKDRFSSGTDGVGHRSAEHVIPLARGLRRSDGGRHLAVTALREASCKLARGAHASHKALARVCEPHNIPVGVTVNPPTTKRPPCPMVAAAPVATVLRRFGRCRHELFHRLRFEQNPFSSRRR